MKFWELSFKQWGKTMQDDITDGVNWIIEEGIGDPDRIAIYGASYGGYATLAGLAFTPDLYACGVDYVGVSNIFTLLDLTETLTFLKSNSSNIDRCLSALSTSASGQGSLYFSKISFSRDPALTPILIEQSLFFAALNTS